MKRNLIPQADKARIIELMVEGFTPLELAVRYNIELSKMKYMHTRAAAFGAFLITPKRETYPIYLSAYLKLAKLAAKTSMSVDQFVAELVMTE